LRAKRKIDEESFLFFKKQDFLKLKIINEQKKKKLTDDG